MENITKGVIMKKVILFSILSVLLYSAPGNAAGREDGSAMQKALGGKAPAPKVARPAPKVARPAPKVARPAPKVARPAPKVARPAPKVVRPAPKEVRPTAEELTAVAARARKAAQEATAELVAKLTAENVVEERRRAASWVAWHAERERRAAAAKPAPAAKVATKTPKAAAQDQEY